MRHEFAPGSISGDSGFPMAAINRRPAVTSLDALLPVAEAATAPTCGVGRRFLPGVNPGFRRSPVTWLEVMTGPRLGPLWAL
ncbi:hypothetical protein GCM10022206_18290 [Streptomyces chiangmaiensis]